MPYLTNLTRPKGDPVVLHTGPSSLGMPDRVGRLLGWFSFGLGGLALAAPWLITRPLGMSGREGLVRAHGVREISAGILTLSVDQTAGLLARTAGDVLDIATVAAADHRLNPRRDNARLALVALVGVALVDVATAVAVRRRHARGKAPRRDYGNRSGYPKGIGHAHGVAAPARQLATA